MQSLLKLSHTKNLCFMLKLHLLICESDCQNLGLNFKMHRVAIFNLIIQLRYGPLSLCWQEKHWLYIVWLAPLCATLHVLAAQWRKGKGVRTGVWHSTCIWQNGKFSSRFLKKFSRDRKDENVSLLWHFVMFLLLFWQPGLSGWVQNGGRHGSLIILIVSKALVRIGQSGLDVEWGGNGGCRPRGGESG